MVQVLCPSCGGPVPFQSAISVFAVCPYCTSMLVRHDLDVESLGKMAVLAEDSSPLQIGSAGMGPAIVAAARLPATLVGITVFGQNAILVQKDSAIQSPKDLKGKTVVVNAFFTSCTSVCPPMNRNMEKIQEVFGDRVGRDVFLVSITVDPEVDTPTRLKEYAQKFHAGKGWIFLTGKKENLDWALYKLGQYVEKKDDHTTIFIIGNEPTGLWKKAFGMANVAELVQIVESVVNDKGGTQ